MGTQAHSCCAFSPGSSQLSAPSSRDEGETGPFWETFMSRAGKWTLSFLSPPNLLNLLLFSKPPHSLFFFYLTWSSFSSGWNPLISAWPPLGFGLRPLHCRPIGHFCIFHIFSYHGLPSDLFLEVTPTVLPGVPSLLPINAPPHLPWNILGVG